MTDSSYNFTNIHLTEPIFANIQFFASGEISEKILDLLKTGGAQRSNYFSDYVTHLICGINPEENDIADATDVYEIPAITSTWVYMCAKLKRITSTRPYLYNQQKLFTNLVFSLSKPGNDLNTLYAIITYHGGKVQLNFDNKCTHLVTTHTNGRKYEKATSLGAGRVTIITPDWIIESIKQNSLPQPDLFHPSRIQWPKRATLKHQESTTSITGFEPENAASLDKENDIVDSTQALLDKLKKRMPWNQAGPSETAPPPNVVAPSFAKLQTNQQPPALQARSFPQQQLQNAGFPRSIVHHTGNQQNVMQQQQQQQSPVNVQQSFNIPNQGNLNRLVNPQQQQPGQPRAPTQIQHLRGQNQLHHHLLQQRIAQQQQQQRPVLSLQQQQLLLQQQQQQQQGRQLIQQQAPIGQPQVALQNPQQIVNPQLVQQSGQVPGNQQFGQPQQQQQQKQQIFPPAGAGTQPQGNLAIQQQFVSQSQQFQNAQPPSFPQNDLNQAQQVSQQQQNPNVFSQQMLVNPGQFAGQPGQNPPQPRQIWQNQGQAQRPPPPPQQQQQQLRHPVNIVQQGTTRLQWSPNQQGPQRQYIQLDAQTHNELQKMPPEQQALFVAKIKHKQLLMQKQIQQRGGHIFIRGSVPLGLNPQQQMQWLQQQAKQQGVVLPPNIQQQTITPGSITQQQSQAQAPNQPQHGLSPINSQQQQQQQQFSVEQQNQQLRQYRLQQLQLQREQAAKSQLVGQPQTAPAPTPVPVQRQALPVVHADSTTQEVGSGGNVQQPLVVNAKTKTALANMLSIRLQSGSTNVEQPQPGQPPQMNVEPSAAGTLRLMTAQHQASLNNSNNRQDLLVMQQQQQQQQQNVQVQRRVINGPNGEIIRAPVTPSTPTGDGPKMAFSPRPTVPLQHRPGPFYGHNPNLKLPPDLFLLGCIFVVVEIERYLDESLPGWQKKIEKHGGEVEKQYCNRITHVLCETQRHGVVMQALRDCKRCITIYWLSDVMKRKQVLPPWTALHLPTIYLDTTPAAKHLIALSGFTGSERTRVKHMINYTGAKFTSYFSKHNTLLIAAKGDGPKYIHAKKWGTPVVNVQWLTDTMLGNFTALNQTEHIVYQQFPAIPNFSFDPKLIPNLMHAWKMPINISQESYERVKRSASPVLIPKKAKKMKTEQTDENDNVNEFEAATCQHRILFSLTSDTDNLKKIVKKLGGGLAKGSQDCTHLVMPALGRTNKLLHCISRGVFILPEQWLRDSHAAEKFLDEANYSLDAKEFNGEYKCDLQQTLQAKNRNRLFAGKFFWITPSVYPSKRDLCELIESCGGCVEKVRRSAVQIEATNLNDPCSYIIITHENDIHLVADLLKSKKDKLRIVCNVEFIFSAILKQVVEVEPFAVKVL